MRREKRPKSPGWMFNPMFVAKVLVTLRKSILDPQGKAVRGSLQSLGLREIQDVRIGRFIEVRIDSAAREDAERVIDEACRKLLANPVMEDYTYTLEKEPVKRG